MKKKLLKLIKKVQNLLYHMKSMACRCIVSNVWQPVVSYCIIHQYGMPLYNIITMFGMPLYHVMNVV